MRILKNILIYALPALMLCNTSCDYLDKEPENKVPEENVDFTQIENMYQAVSGVYAKVRTGGMHWVIWPFHSDVISEYGPSYTVDLQEHIYIQH